MNPLKLGTIAAAAGVLMFLVDMLWQPIFTVRFTDSFAVPIWALAAVYAALQFYVWSLTRKGIALSDAEVRKWGPALEKVTPEILARINERTSVKAIAADLEKAHRIPKDVTLRYIIALGSYQKAGADEGQSPGADAESEAG